MGLDITAYRGLTKIDNAEMEDGQPKNWETDVMFWSNYPEFPGRSEGVDTNGTVYNFADKFGFRAGSYSGYNNWRELLAEFAGYDGARQVWDGKTGPFSELINFADNEGTIGPVVSAKLARDFAEFQERADAFTAPEDWGNYWHQKYNDWRKAFEMAADNGAVAFH